MGLHQSSSILVFSMFPVQTKLEENILKYHKTRSPECEVGISKVVQILVINYSCNIL